jgi:serine protease
MRQHFLRHSPLITSCLTLLALSACGGGSDPSTTPTSGSIAGTVVTLDNTAGGTKPKLAAQLVPGQVIIKFRSGLQVTNLKPLGASVGGSSLKLRKLRSSGVGNSGLTGTEVKGANSNGVYQADGLSESQTLEMIQNLRRRPDVLWAEPNGIRQALAVPNDPLYARQWHYQAFNLERAWAITKGNAATVVAVLDTGILFKDGDASKTHPDFVGKVVPGADTISDAKIGNDGDGRDNDAFDVGDTIGKQSSYHGSHVAGTIAAATNNGLGVAGIDWNAKIRPVRVLGVGGGTDEDIADGIRWAVGIDVTGLTPNANPAKVLNLSLGGDGPCSQVYKDAINEANAKGAIIVVAAGNENADTGNKTPANCPGVITVGATNSNNARAPYSNFGKEVTVMAPGGDTALSLEVGGVSFEAGILSTLRNDDSGEFNYTMSQGTSMATPHIAGLISLMLDLKATLTRDVAIGFLKASAKALTDAECAQPSSTNCGAELVDAAKALALLKDSITPGAVPIPDAPPAAPVATRVKTFVLANDPAGKEVKRLEITGTGSSEPFKLEGLPLGTYSLLAVSDLKADGAVNTDDPTSKPLGVTLSGTQNNLTGVQLQLRPSSSK